MKTIINKESATTANNVINMASTLYIIYQRTDVNEGIVLDGFKCAFKGERSEMAARYREFISKAQRLIELGEATDFKEYYDEDGTLWFRFTRDGKVMKTFLCDRKRAAFLTA